VGRFFLLRLLDEIMHIFLQEADNSSGQTHEEE
jgi:hypothetical protein